jgi:hypothetical protein
VSHALSHQPACTAAIVLLTSSWLFCSTVLSADARVPVVRLYDTTSGTGEIRGKALSTAAAVVRDAGIPVEWRDCTRAGSQPGCQQPRLGDFIVRIVPAANPGTVPVRHSLQLRTVRSEEQLQLGVAVLDPVTLTGQMATVFQEPVQRLASRTGVDPATLLGRAIAHEIGHLLLRTTSHSATGLMREVWSLEELTSNDDDDWRFAAGDRRRLQEQFALNASPDPPLPLRADARSSEPLRDAKWGRAAAFRPARQNAGRGSVLEK